MAKKFPEALCIENYAKVTNLFRSVISNPERYNVVYGCGVDVGMMDFVVVRRTTYTYSNYAIGYDAGNHEIVILPIDTDIISYGVPYYLKKSEIGKASRNRISSEITIRHDRLPKKYIQFVIPPSIREDDDEVCIPIIQDDQAKQFEEYYARSYAELGEAGFLQKLVSKILSPFT
jgi:hypothetical protein